MSGSQTDAPGALVQTEGIRVETSLRRGCCSASGAITGGVTSGYHQGTIGVLAAHGDSCWGTPSLVGPQALGHKQIPTIEPQTCDASQYFVLHAVPNPLSPLALSSWHCRLRVLTSYLLEPPRAGALYFINASWVGALMAPENKEFNGWVLGCIYHSHPLPAGLYSLVSCVKYLSLICISSWLGKKISLSQKSPLQRRQGQEDGGCGTAVTQSLILGRKSPAPAWKG